MRVPRRKHAPEPAPAASHHTSVTLAGAAGTYAAKNQAGALTNLPLEVHYNCLKAGSTAVRVVFTSDVNNADVQLEWTKKCAAQPAVARHSLPL